MASLVNRPARGLLSLLDIKSLGQNPSVLPDQLQAVVDVTDLYISDGQRYAVGTLAISSPSVQPIGGPPATAIWIVDHIGISFVSGPAEALQCFLYITNPANPSSFIPISSQLVIGADTFGTIVVREPMILANGDSLGISIGAVSGTISTSWGYRYKELAI